MSETVYVRLRLVLLALALGLVAVFAQLVRLVFGSDVTYFKDLSQEISQVARDFAPARGRIFDRDGELLATNDVQYEVGISPPYVVVPDDVVDTLSDLLDMSAKDIEDAIESDSRYVLLARPVSAEIGNEIRRIANDESIDVNLGGVSLTPIPHRYYPGGPLAAQVLGFVAYNHDGQQVGYYGVEGFYNDLLAGRAVRGIQNMVPFDVQLDPTPDQGTDLYLTIDRDVQFLVEQTLAAAVEEHGARSGSIIVLDPRTGEVLAMAAWPTFDPNNYVEFPPTNPANPVVSGQYEPGSTFKVLTMAAAIDAGRVTPQTPFMDNGSIEVGGINITNWNGGAWGPVDMLGCMQHSLNVCLASVATWLGPTDFYNYLGAFGIGRPTGIDVAAETGGRLKRPGDPDWFDSDLGTNSFGQGVAVSPLQLVAAVSAVANHGTLMQPHVLDRVQDGENVYQTQPQVLGRPLRPDTADTLNRMLADSLEAGEGSQALVPGYRVSGKTGTAQIPRPGGYDPTETIGSFVGWGPVDDPRFIVLVKLDEPSSSIWGSETAAPVFRKLVERLVVLLEIPPDAVRAAMAGN